MAGERYVEITLEQMDKALVEKRAFERYTVPGTGEYLYDRRVVFADGYALPMRIRVYSSIDLSTKVTRPLAGDSIKVVLVNDNLTDEDRLKFPRGIPLTKKELPMGTKRVFRTKSALENLDKAILDMYESAELLACPKCGGPLKPRSGGFGQFYGCRTYPTCTGTKRYEEVHPNG